MGKLYDFSQQIQDYIDRTGQDAFKARGELALRCGFLITLVKPTDPDDAQKLQALKDAAHEVFGIDLS